MDRLGKYLEAKQVVLLSPLQLESSGTHTKCCSGSTLSMSWSCTVVLRESSQWLCRAFHWTIVKHLITTSLHVESLTCHFVEVSGLQEDTCRCFNSFSSNFVANIPELFCNIFKIKPSLFLKCLSLEGSPPITLIISFHYSILYIFAQSFEKW